MNYQQYRENAKTNSATITEDQFVEISVNAMHSLPKEIVNSPAIFMTMALVTVEMSKMIFHPENAEKKGE